VGARHQNFEESTPTTRSEAAALHQQTPLFALDHINRVVVRFEARICWETRKATPNVFFGHLETNGIMRTNLNAKMLPLLSLLAERKLN